MAGFRGLLYTLAKLMGEYNAVKKGKVSQRVGRWAPGKAAARPYGSCSTNQAPSPFVSEPDMENC